MYLRSDDVEVLYGRAKSLSAELKRLRGAEVTKADLKNELAGLAREWLRLSPVVRELAVCRPERIEVFDQRMKELLTSTTTRARATALSAKLSDFIDSAFDDVVIPLIQFEGSPRQVAARQIQSIFSSSLFSDEAQYIEEAARCVTVQCHRAAVIMLWAAGVARLHAAVTKCGFDAYNRAVDAVMSKKGAPFNRVKDGAKISSLPELQRSRDADVLLVGMELFGYDLQVFQELDRLLGARNDAAHPGMAQPGALDIQQFASKLKTLIFDRIKI
jgi:hypothetical protein